MIRAYRELVLHYGDGGAETTTLRSCRSTDAATTAADTAVGPTQSQDLRPFGIASEPTDLPAPPRPGTYYDGAGVDVVSGKSHTTRETANQWRVLADKRRVLWRAALRRPPLFHRQGPRTPSLLVQTGQSFGNSQEAAKGSIGTGAVLEGVSGGRSDQCVRN